MIFLAPGVDPSLIHESTHVKFFRCVESTNTAANILSLPGISRNFEHLPHRRNLRGFMENCNSQDLFPCSSTPATCLAAQLYMMVELCDTIECLRTSQKDYG